MRLLTLDTAAREGVTHDPSIEKRVLLRRGDIPHVTQLAQARLEPGQVARGHAHGDMYEVFLVAAGTGRITVDGCAHPLTVGTCVVVEPGETHEVAGVGPEALVLTYFGVAR